MKICILYILWNHTLKLSLNQRIFVQKCLHIFTCRLFCTICFQMATKSTSLGDCIRSLCTKKNAYLMVCIFLVRDEGHARFGLITSAPHTVASRHSLFAAPLELLILRSCPLRVQVPTHSLCTKKNAYLMVCMFFGAR